MKIINLTQHKATQDQVDAGVIDLTGATLDHLKNLITFHQIPETGEMRTRAKAIVAMTKAVAKDLHIDPDGIMVMVGGAPYFMPTLQQELDCSGIEALYSFTERVVVEKPGVDGKVEKTSEFKHVGWVRG